MPKVQLGIIKDLCLGEEGDFFRSKLIELAEAFAAMPVKADIPKPNVRSWSYGEVMVGSNLRLALILMMLFLVSCGDDSPEPETYDFTFRTATETSGATSYIFEGKYKPPLNLIGGEYADHWLLPGAVRTQIRPAFARLVRQSSVNTGPAAIRTQRMALVRLANPVGILQTDGCGAGHDER